jgi:putative hydrolase of the HAD superfamily
MIELVGFDADDTLWRCQEYFDDAQAEFEGILARYIDVTDARVHRELLATERRNIGLFGYGAKGMTLSMIETAIVLTDERISAADLHRVMALGRRVLQQPVELLPGVREAVEAVSRDWPVVLITKGDLFHQERKVAESGLADLFQRIEIVSEKDPPTYARLFREFGLTPPRFAMVGNSRARALPHHLGAGGRTRPGGRPPARAYGQQPRRDRAGAAPAGGTLNARHSTRRLCAVAGSWSQRDSPACPAARRHPT